MAIAQQGQADVYIGSALSNRDAKVTYYADFGCSHDIVEGEVELQGESWLEVGKQFRIVFKDDRSVHLTIHVTARHGSAVRFYGLRVAR